MLPMTAYFDQPASDGGDPADDWDNGHTDDLNADDAESVDPEPDSVEPDSVEDEPDTDDQDGDGSNTDDQDGDGHGAAYIQSIIESWPGTGDDAWDEQTQAAKVLYLRSTALSDKKLTALAEIVYPDSAPAIAMIRLACSGVPRWLPAALSTIDSIAGAGTDFDAMALAKALPAALRKNVEAALEMLGSPVGTDFAAMPGADIAQATKGVAPSKVAATAKTIAKAQALRLTDRI